MTYARVWNLCYAFLMHCATEVFREDSAVLSLINRVGMVCQWIGHKTSQASAWTEKGNAHPPSFMQIHVCCNCSRSLLQWVLLGMSASVDMADTFHVSLTISYNMQSAGDHWLDTSVLHAALVNIRCTCYLAFVTDGLHWHHHDCHARVLPRWWKAMP